MPRRFGFGIDLPAPIGNTVPGRFGIDLPAPIGINLPAPIGIAVPGCIGIDLPASIGSQLRNLEWIRYHTLNWFGRYYKFCYTGISQVGTYSGTYRSEVRILREVCIKGRYVPVASYFHRWTLESLGGR